MAPSPSLLAAWHKQYAVVTHRCASNEPFVTGSRATMAHSPISNSQSTLWMLSILAFFLFIVMACMEVLRSRVLVVVSSRIDKALGPTIYRATMQSELRSGTSSANGQVLSDITQLRQFLTGPAVFAVFDAPASKSSISPSGARGRALSCRVLR